MIRSMFIFVLFFSSVLTLRAQENALLWKVSGNGLSEPSYVFGTMHVLCDNAVVNKTAVKNAFSSADKLVLELDPTDPSVLQEMQQLAVNPGFENIYQDLPKEDYALLDGFLTGKFGAGLAQMGILKPFTLSSMVIMGFLPCDQPFSPESHLVSEAKDAEKQIFSLETASFQIGLFDEIPSELQIQEIVRLLKDNIGQDELTKMMEVYLSGDLAGLYTLINSNDMMGQYKQVLLDNRNLEWLPRLEDLFRSGPTFVAVGAGHLPGEKGVLSLLRELGYVVEVAM
jgi:uncharacterized protein YbaP (TraB family)